MEKGIEHISDTANWIAGYRAQETDRKDAIFKDLLASKLAGDHGMEIVRTTPRTKEMAFAMVVRTTAIDRLVESAVKKGIDTVINLGAGLDTRPYRMKLPYDLRWIEVDYPVMIDYKDEKLKTDKPVCILKRVAADLSVDTERKKIFAQLGSETKKVLVITEGVIGYLTNEMAEQLSRDLFAIPSFRYWIQDYSQGKKSKAHKKVFVKKLRRAPLQFNVDNPIEFFGKNGWKVEENIYILDEADRIGRKLPLRFPISFIFRLFPAKIRKIANKTYGYVMFGR